jgi:hypothetical protein
VFQQVGHLVSGEDDREAHRPLRALDTRNEPQITEKNALVEEDQRVQGLVLCGRADVPPDRDVGEKGSDFVGAQLARVPDPVVKDESLDPVDVRLLGSGAVVEPADGRSDAIEQLGLFRCPVWGCWIRSRVGHGAPSS